MYYGSLLILRITVRVLLHVAAQKISVCFCIRFAAAWTYKLYVRKHWHAMETLKIQEFTAVRFYNLHVQKI